ncbi:UNVERIFIED_CONTAM: hypothetical protein FKN15_073695 [Acipenser sinensis]
MVAVACGLNLKRDAGNEQTLARSSTLKRVERKLSVDPDSLRPLRRTKRRWVLTTIEVEEGDPGPFPKFAANVAVACGLNLKRDAGNEQTLARSSTLKRVVRKLSVDPDSLRPLRRTKRRWVLTTIEVEEGDPGPFPKFAANLFNDREINLTIKYLISGPGVDENPRGYFSVDDKTGEVYMLKTVDREATPTFVIRFDVADRRTGKIVDQTLMFNIDVKDKNDNAPKFKNPVVDILLKENSPAGSDVFLLQAEDIDQRGTPNSEFSYSVVSQEPPSTKSQITINPKTGIVSFEGCLDYQSTKSYKILVEAKDHGDPQLSSTATMNIKIEDANNYPPVFVKKEFTGNVKEQQVGVPVLRVSVEDKDTPNTPAWRAKYTVTKGNEDGNYKIETDPQTNDGILTVIKPLDYEKGSRNELEISVENEEPLYICPGAGGSAPTAGGSVPTAGGYHVPVVINVEDVNDPPYFEPSEITVYQTEGTKVPIQLGKVHAVDLDAAHSTLRYEIPAGGDPAKWLTVDKNTGEVTAIAEMDRESPYVNNSIYSVIVLAVDDGKPPQTGTGTVLIHLTDVNDNNPFLDSKYVHMCDDPKNTSIVVKATDKDIEPYSGPFIFQLLDKGNDVTNTWKLEQLQGESIKLLRLRELPTGNYTVPLKIIDQQGLATEEDLMLRICECSQEGVCRPLEAQSTSFGGAAIGALIGALLLMLLLLLCCVRCDCSGKKISEFPPDTVDEGNQTLIKYNDEGGGCRSQMEPAMYSRIMSLKERNLESERMNLQEKIATHLDMFQAHRNGMSQLSHRHKRSWIIAMYKIEEERRSTFSLGRVPHLDMFQAHRNGMSQLSHRHKRSWIIAMYKIEEERRSTFSLGRVPVNVSDDTKVEYQISGMGVDEEPKGVLRINRDTGELYVVKKVDREKHQSLKLKFTAFEVYPRTLNTHLGIDISILDINDHAPTFKSESYSATVKEGTAQGVPPMTGTATLVIYITDVNDNIPHLVTTDIDMCVGETASVANLTAEDKDEEPYSGPFFFQLLEKESLKGKWRLESTLGYTVRLIKEKDVYSGVYVLHFKIQDTQGESSEQNLTVTVCECTAMHKCNPLRLTSHSMGAGAIGVALATLFLILVEAKDEGDKIQLSSSTTVFITVEDENNNRPVMKGTNLVATVKERDSNVTLLRIKVSDRDKPHTPGWKAKYTIVSGNENKNYKILTDPDTNDGVLTLVTSLDYEDGQKRNLSIMVENEIPYSTCTVKKVVADGLWKLEKTSDEAAETRTITIIVEDVNDPPEFIPPFGTVYVEENSATGIKLKTFTAVDRDASLSSKFRYSVGVDPLGWVSIDQTGTVTNKQKVDRESPSVKNNTYTVTLLAIDNGVPPMTGTATLVIYITDVNDNIPHLVTTDIDMCVGETASVANLTAEDKDEEPYSGPFFFQLLEKESLKGKWRLESTLGYTHFGLHQAHIDESSQTLQRHKRAWIIDSYEIEEERAPRYFLGKIEIERKQNVRYILSGMGIDKEPKNVIKIDENTGEIYVLKKVDREQYQSLTHFGLHQAHIDESSQTLQRHKRAWIIDSYEIEEERAPRYFLGKIEIERKQNVRYILSGMGIDKEPKNVIKIDENTGEIYVLKKVDREQYQSLTLTFVAIDTIGGVLDTELGVSIKIKDINDNVPTFDHQIYMTTVEESQVQGGQLILVRAEDKDERNTPNSTFTYKIVSQTPMTDNALFYIDQAGIISFRGCIDYEKAQKYTIVVEAKDQGEKVQLSSSTTVIVDVEDGNNHLPVQEGVQLVANVKERDSNVTLLRIKVSDRDKPHTPGWKAKYTIVSGNENNNYKILTDPDTNDGVLTLVKVKELFFLFHVEQPSGQLILVRAEDKDERNTPNSTFTYKIVSQTPMTDNALFYIDQAGIISFRGCIDYEKAQKYTIVVEAKDQGEKVQLSSSTTVIVDVEDGNNHLPVQEGVQLVANVKERDSNVTLLRIKVSDRDKPHTPGWKAKYTIVSGNENNNYKILTDPDTNDGVLTLVKPLDFEDGYLRELSVQVENETPFFSCSVKRVVADDLWEVDYSDPEADSTGIGFKPKTLTVIVNVEDINDAPDFVPPIKTVYLEENDKIGKELQTFTAIDKDGSLSSEFRYTVGVDPAGWVSIDPKTGTVITTQLMDRESPFVINNTYTVILHAVDNGKPPMTGSGTLVIHLTDVNDCIPYLLTPHIDMCANETASMTKLAAQDDDEDPYSGPFSFNLLEKESLKGKWRLDPTHGKPPMTGSGTLVIHLTDVNDCIPYLLTPHIDMCANETASMTKLAAQDDDEDPYSGPFSFNLLEKESLKGKWRLDPTHGYSVNLIKEKNVYSGIYILHLEISDRQGVSSKHNLTVAVCDCPTSAPANCGTRRLSSPTMGSSAVGILFAALFLMLAALLLVLSMAGFLNICSVAYRAQQRKTLHAVSKMVLVWVLAFLLYGPAIIAWEHIAGHSIVEKEECYAEFYYNWYFLITASTVEFFTPFISVTFFNVSIYLNIRWRTQSRQALNKETRGVEPEGIGPDPLSELSTQDKELSQSKPMTSVPMGPCLELEGKAETIDLMNPGNLAPKEKDAEKSKGGEFSHRLPSMIKRTRAISQTSAQHFRLLRDKKVAKSLAIIVCTFGVCWAPYTLLMIIRAACNDSCISRYWYEVSFWLLWINSAINPVLYPLCHSSFRKAFMKLLCPKKFKMKASLRST